MTERRSAVSAEPYSPQLRTALVLTGTGTAGAYHAGVLRALHESGVKLDIVAGRGIGAVGALFAAIDGGPRLWEEKGFWRTPAVRSLYNWRLIVRIAGWALIAAFLIVAIPLVVVAVGLVVFPIDFVLRMVGQSGNGLVAAYLAFANAAFAPAALPTWLPRLVLLVLGLVLAIAAVMAWRERGSRHERGGVWWRLLRAPLSSRDASEHCWRTLWDLVRGAAQVRQPPARDLARRYTELLAENLGQPGFRELLLLVHDVDARRDLVFALVSEPRRRDLVRRSTSGEADARRAEVLDLSGVGRDHLTDAIAAALSVPLATEFHAIRLGVEAYWRGETHRLCDRPSSLPRILEELAMLEVEQVIIVSASPEAGATHELPAPRRDIRARLGEYVQSSESAALRDCVRNIGAIARVFTIQPAHNPTGPFDFDGGFDDRSDRPMRLEELMNRGYEDAYRQFIEPVVAASGDRVGQGVTQ
jgi:hypothetical protein